MLFHLLLDILDSGGQARFFYMTILLTLAFFASPVHGARGLADTVVPELETTLVETTLQTPSCPAMSMYNTGLAEEMMSLFDNGKPFTQCTFCQMALSNPGLGGLPGLPTLDNLYTCCMDQTAYDQKDMGTAYTSWIKKSTCTEACPDMMKSPPSWWKCTYP